MKQLLLTSLSFIFSVLQSSACVCDLTPFKTKQDLAMYSFIAHVRITRIDSVQTSNYSQAPVHKAYFQLLELFKGDSVDHLLFDGGHRSLKLSHTSCDLGENTGEEWVLFAYPDKNNKLMTHFCSNSFRYKATDGYRDKSDVTPSTIERLRALYISDYAGIKHNGPYTEYYTNGKKELEEIYRKNKLHGQRLLWYANGLLEEMQHYHKGKKHGVFESYSKTGQLLSKSKFKNGLPIDTAIYWHETDTAKQMLKLYAFMSQITVDSAKVLFSKNQIVAKYIYNNNGNLIYFSHIERNGNMTEERIYTYHGKEQRRRTRYYHMLHENTGEEFRVNDKEGWYKEWNKEGRLVKSWEYDNKGNQIKESIKIDNPYK